MAGQEGTWGVTEVVIRYHSKDGQWEVSIPPSSVDILVFNWERYQQINKIIGGTPITKGHHLNPDGGSHDGEFTPEEIARQLGSNGPPRRIGEPVPVEAGEYTGPICVHQTECTYYCTDENHVHED